MTEDTFYVEYQIPSLSGNKTHEAGPYVGYWLAREHMDDITSYSEVTEARIKLAKDVN